jgi:hypothetical protein
MLLLPPLLLLLAATTVPAKSVYKTETDQRQFGVPVTATAEAKVYNPEYHPPPG